MLLYHYASERFKLLRTVENRKALTPSQIKEAEQESYKRYKVTGLMLPGYYFQHVSFFFEPPPLSDMSSIFPPEHEVWSKGRKLFEHSVDSRSMGGFNYYLVESAEMTQLRYATDPNDKSYYPKLKQIIKEHNYIGSGSEELERCCSKYLGSTTKTFRQIKGRPDYENFKLKYAPTVPHVMLYPTTGQIKPISIKEVVCG